MKKRFLVITSGILVLLSACNNSSESKSTTDSNAVATDTTATVMPDTTAMAAPTVDSAAITNEFVAAEKKSKKTTPPKPKKQKDSVVEIYAEEPIQSHEALEQPAPAAGAPRDTTVIHTKEYVYFAPSEAASFPGGQAKLQEFIGKNIMYPEDALRYHVEGTVFAEVSLDAEGHVTNVEFPGTHIGTGLEEETKTVLMRSPRWHPAKESGKAVASKVTVPVVYKIDHHS